MKSGFVRAFVALLLMLGAASFALWSSRTDTLTRPAATNLGPSGLAGLAETLRRRGHTVTIDRRERPRVDGAGLVIVVDLETSLGGFFDEISRGLAIERDRPIVVKRLESRALDGLHVLELAMPGDFAAGSAAVKGEEPATTALQPDAAPRPISRTPSSADFSDYNLEGEGYTLWQGEELGLVHATAIGQGLFVRVEPGILATNRFLDEARNADMIVDVVERAHAGRGRIVFAEASFGNVEREGFLGVVGSWAVAAQWQLILLGLVVVYSVGQRLGRSDPDHEVQRGGRDMVDAVAETLRRARRPGFAAKIVAERALDDARILIGLPPGTPPQTVLAAMPEEDRRLLEQALRAEEGGPHEAFPVAQRLAQATLGWSRARLRRK